MICEAAKWVLVVGSLLLFAPNCVSQSTSAKFLEDQLDSINRDFNEAVDRRSVRRVRYTIPRYESLITAAKDVGDRRCEAIAATRLGHALALTGQTSDAITHLRLAFSLWESIGAHLSAANVLTTLGSLQYATEDYQNARESLEQSSTLRGQFDNLAEVNTRVALGGVYKALEDSQKSAASYEMAVSLSATIEDKYAIGFALARRVSQRGTTTRIDYLRQAVEAYREAGEKSEFSEGVSNRILISSGDQIAAFSQFDRAKFLPFKSERERQDFLTRRRSSELVPLTYDEGDRGRGAIALANLGQEYSFKNLDRAKALELFNEALDWSRSSGSWRSEGYVLGCLSAYYAIPTNNERFLLFTTLIQLNTLHDVARRGFERDGKTNGPRASIESGLISFEKRRSGFVSEELRAAFTIEVRRYFERFVELLMEMHLADPAGEHDKLALKAAELARSRALRDSLKVSGVELRTGIDPELLKREIEIRNSLNALAEDQDRPARSNVTGQSVKDQIASLALEYAEVHGKIRQAKLKGVPVEPPDPTRFARIRNEFRLVFKEDDPIEPLPFTIFDIQNELIDANTVLLEYFLGDEQSFLWAVTDTGIASYILPSQKEIERLARETYRQISDSATNSKNARPVNINPEDAQKLSDVILGPVLEQMKEKRLAIVADGALQYVPFSALPLPRAKSATEKPASQPLAITNEVIYLPSASVLSVLRREAASRKPKGSGIAVVADPVFSETDERLTIGDVPVKKGEKSDLSRMVLERAFSFNQEKNKPLTIPRLPFTRREAEGILSMAPVGSSRVDLQACKLEYSIVSPK